MLSMQPFAKAATLVERQLVEQSQASSIADRHYCVQLMQMEYGARVADELRQGCKSIARTAVAVEYYDAYLRTAMARVKTDEVGYAYRLTTPVVYHEPQLPVRIYVRGGIGYIVAEDITGIGNIGGANIPFRHSVLYCLEHLQILRLHGTELYRWQAAAHLITSSLVIITPSSG